MPYMSVTPGGGRQLRVRIGHHSVLTDLPAEWGGHDSGPTPTELFVGSLASCGAHHALAFLVRNHVDSTGLEVGCHYDLAEHPDRVEAVHLTLRVPAGLTEEQERGLVHEIQRCIVNASIATPTQLHVIVARGERELAAVG